MVDTAALMWEEALQAVPRGRSLEMMAYPVSTGDQ
jgi:hypothetical protein